jgi:hypothetical protein
MLKNAVAMASSTLMLKKKNNICDILKRIENIFMKLNYLYSKMAVLRFMLGLTEYVVS